MTIQDFYTEEEKQLTSQFLRDKHYITPAEDMSALDAIRKKIAQETACAMGVSAPADSQVGSFLNYIHKDLSVDALNEVRLKVITAINSEGWFRKAYFKVARNAIMSLVGNELAMQRRVNLSIQLPNDDSSLLPVHADVWSGDSPYEIVMWLPLVDCFATKSMYLADPSVDEKMQVDFSLFKDKSSEDLFQAIKDNVTFIEIPYGSVLLFSQNVMHGNRVNVESETRWSMNCRFKSVLTPYHGKKMGEFFEPITVRPLTRLGLNYRLPGGLNE